MPRDEPAARAGIAPRHAWACYAAARMSRQPSKSALKEELVRLLATDLETLERAQRAALEGATHEEAKPENDKDTRALEQSYLARGQSMRIEELRGDLAKVQSMPVRDFASGDPAALGALVTIEDDEGERVLFIAPAGGGSRLDGGTVQVTTPRAPLGRALLGKTEGDDLEIRIDGKERIFSLTRLV